MAIGPRESTERLDVRSIHRILQSIAVSKNLPAYHPHQLRHACATHMHDHGAPIQAVAAMLGHARLSTAQIHAGFSGSNARCLSEGPSACHRKGTSVSACAFGGSAQVPHEGSGMNDIRVGLAR